MKLAFSSNAFKRYPLLEAIEVIHQLGYQGVEIMCDIPHAYPPDLGAAQRKLLYDSVKQKGMGVANLNAFMLYALGDTYHPSYIEKDEAERRKRIEHTLHCIDLAVDLKAPAVSIEPGGPLLDVSRNWAMGAFREAIDEIGKYAAHRGVWILIEPEPKMLIETSRQFVEFMEQVTSSAVGLNFDIGHFYCVGEDPAELAFALADYTKHYHLEDIAATRVHQHLIPGKGAIPFERVLAAIAQSGYHGFITIELYPYDLSPADAARVAFDAISPLLGKLTAEQEEGSGSAQGLSTIN
jgi:fructoselysine 3-epimerase